LAFCADPDVMKTLGGVQPPNQAWRGFMAVAGSWTLLGYGMFSVLERTTGKWIGRVGPWNPEGWPGPEVGWALRKEAWGHGYATEAAATAMNWAFGELGWPEIVHLIEPSNPKSAAVAQRLGSRWLRKGLLPAPYGNECEVFGQSREDWSGRL
jgi:RimJ/RimL family protein N-acetyltransferase